MNCRFLAGAGSTGGLAVQARDSSLTMKTILMTVLLAWPYWEELVLTRKTAGHRGSNDAKPKFAGRCGALATSHSESSGSKKKHRVADRIFHAKRAAVGAFPFLQGFFTTWRCAVMAASFWPRAFPKKFGNEAANNTSNVALIEVYDLDRGSSFIAVSWPATTPGVMAE